MIETTTLVQMQSHGTTAFNFETRAATKEFANQRLCQPVSAPLHFSKSWSGVRKPSRLSYTKTTFYFFYFGGGYVSTQCPLNLQSYGRFLMATAPITFTPPDDANELI